MLDNPNTKRSPLQALSQSEFMGKTTVREFTLSIGTTVTQVLKNNPNRLSYIIINESANDLRLSNNVEITSTSGWLLSNTGGIISDHFKDSGEAVAYPVFAIGAAAASTIRVREVTRL